MTAQASRKRYTPEFKGELVLQLLDGKTSAAALSWEHGVPVQVLHGWRREARWNVATWWQGGSEGEEPPQKQIWKLDVVAHPGQVCGGWGVFTGLRS